MTSTEDDWIRASETAVKTYLNINRGVPTQAPEGGVNPMKVAMNQITRQANIEYATQLAGYSKGIYNFDGRRILVTRSPKIISPKEGDWTTIEHLLFGMFGNEQIEYLFGWLKTAYESLVQGTFVPGQVLVFAGPKDCGKTFLQNYIITKILGGRCAKPYMFMTGQSSFNADLFTGEHQIISDENPATDTESRRAFGAAIKNLIVEPEQRGRNHVTPVLASHYICER